MKFLLWMRQLSEEITLLSLHIPYAAVKEVFKEYLMYLLLVLALRKKPGDTQKYNGVPQSCALTVSVVRQTLHFDRARDAFCASIRSPLAMHTLLIIYTLNNGSENTSGGVRSGAFSYLYAGSAHLTKFLYIANVLLAFLSLYSEGAKDTATRKA
jgi:hypothetical protein